MTVLAAAPFGQGPEQIGELGPAFVLPALIGLERELRQEPAGLRTLTVVGFASALFILISKCGFSDVPGRSSAGSRCGSPSRGAAGSPSSPPRPPTEDDGDGG